MVFSVRPFLFGVCLPTVWTIDGNARENTMTDKRVWLVTGAGRGLGVNIARAALAAGHAVVATGRDTQKVMAAVGKHDDLLAVKLDVTQTEDAHAAVEAVIARFGRTDVLVNNAGNFYAGFFEELSPEQVRSQIETLLFGPINVTRAVLPVMRKQRAGLVMTISSTAGIGLADYEARVLRTKQLALQRLARQFGQQLVPLPPITTTQLNQ
jgi:NAD(P)-dependent dehydrogenase (short-subunit alcohol dehydrogenase family)